MKYTKSHEWVDVNDNIATIGITEYAAKELGEIVYVELPDVGTVCAAEDEVATVESVKAASDIYVPVSGTVTEVNEMLEDKPMLACEDPEGDGWFFKLELNEEGSRENLMSEDEYQEFIQQ